VHIFHLTLGDIDITAMPGPGRQCLFVLVAYLVLCLGSLFIFFAFKTIQGNLQRYFLGGGGMVSLFDWQREGWDDVFV
jgi:hypothetical protein